MADYSSMSDADLMAMVQPKQAAPAQQDYSKLSDADLMKMVKPQQPSITDAVTDIPAEIGRTASANYDTIKQGVTDRGSKGPIEGLMDTGKALLAVPGLLASPITGAARSLIGHPMAQAEHAVGSYIAPDIAAKDDPQQMYQNAAGDVETALAGARPSTIPGKIPTPLSPELKTAATSVYESPAIKAIDVPPADVTALAGKIENSLLQRGNRPTTGNAPATFAEVKNLYPDPAVQSVKVDDLRSARRALNIAAGQRDPLTGVATPDANAATHAIGHLDDFLDNLAPELKTANANYAASKQADSLDYRMAKAEHRAARTGTGGNLENVMRQEADKIQNRGLTPQEQAARDQLVMGTPLRNTLRTAGKLGVDGGLSLMLHAGAAIGTGGTTLPVTIAGTIARKLGEHLTRGDMGKLSEQIRSRSPLAQALAASAQTPQISQKSKAMAAALMSQGRPAIQMPMSILPANANQNQQ